MYLIDRSAAPSPSADGGIHPDSSRATFLHSVLSMLSTTAKVLVLTGNTGKSASAEWVRINEAVTAWFLATESPDRRPVPDARLQVFDANGRRVIWSWALGGRARLGAGYFHAVSALISEGDVKSN